MVAVRAVLKVVSEALFIRFLFDLRKSGDRSYQLGFDVGISLPFEVALAAIVRSLRKEVDREHAHTAIAGFSGTRAEETSAAFVVSFNHAALISLNLLRGKRLWLRELLSTVGPQVKREQAH